MRRAGLRRRRAEERGSGLLPTVFGLGVLLGLLGLCANVALGLWSRSTTESIAYDAARAVATAPGDADPAATRAQALQRACDALGSRCGEVRMDFTAGSVPPPEVVELHVEAPGVRLLPRMLGARGPVVAGLDRTIRIRRERQ